MRTVAILHVVDRLDSAVRTSPTLIRLRGWTIDPDVFDPIGVRVDMAGLTVTTGPADQSRGDVGSAYPYFGSLHGFDITIPAPPVTQTVCVTATNVGAGADRTIACRTV